MKKAILQGTLILFVGYLFIFWLFKYSPFKFPTNVPNTSVNMSGLATIALLIIFFVVFFRKYLRSYPEASIGELVLIAGVAGLYSGLFFEVIRHITLTNILPMERVVHLLMNTLLIAIFAALFGFLVALHLKKRKIRWLLWFVILLLLLFNLFGSYKG
ncbi:MAG: hypothetical protein JST68_11775 [Bacteroidetes bacterium]|nr:hypothetical protein [Bacteroidota bacterium]